VNLRAVQDRHYNCKPRPWLEVETVRRSFLLTKRRPFRSLCDWRSLRCPTPRVRLRRANERKQHDCLGSGVKPFIQFVMWLRLSRAQVGVNCSKLGLITVGLSRRVGSALIR